VKSLSRSVRDPVRSLSARLFPILVGAAVVMGQGREAFNLNERALEAAGRGDQVVAQRLYREAIEIWRRLGPDYQAHLGTTEFNLGQTLCALGRRAEARPLYEDAVRLLRGTVGVRHRTTLGAMNYLASLQLILGDTGAAEALFREALAIERELYPEDPQTALSLTGLSSFLVRQDRIAEALPLAEEALAIAIETAGDQSVNAALAYDNLATVHRSSRRYDRALPLYRKSFHIYAQLLGPEHPRTASLLSEIGLVEMDDGKYALAERDLTRALEIIGRLPGWDFERWMGESNLGILRLKQGKYEEAARRLARSLAIQEQAGIHAGRDFAITLETLAQVRDKQRRFEEAKQLHDRAALLSSYH